ncbi:hypothetical protein DM01DRAFT_1337277 [Hesseltinella vesiculosa]|uniref:Uncharacterized protein n=1 Tax=Hesseltinella vesiculosa TaxID=101127 RepID=A0A1X2GDF1_9FUNG|nr:hypothetical protein DM01DRAFT_1337277 [Hesseltinella vesiculosa]
MAIIEELHDPPPSLELPTPISTPIPSSTPLARDNSNEPLQQHRPTHRLTDDDDHTVYFYDAAEDEQELLDQAMEYKVQGNQHFGLGEFQQALQCYQDAMAVYPANQGQPDQRSIFAANMAACYLKLDQPKEAKQQCDIALGHDPNYTKAKLRRAQSCQQLATSAALSEALSDYEALLEQHGQTNNVLDAPALRQCRLAIQQLPPQIKALQEKEKEEMLGKLKDLGNTLLGKFGLSTDNFQFQKDPATGSYSMNFVNNP